MKLNVADEDKCKSHLGTESDSHSFWANLAAVADSTDMAGLIPRHIFEAKSISKQPVITLLLWIRSLGRSANTNYSAHVNCQGRSEGQTDRQTARQVGRQMGDEDVKMETHAWL